MKIFGSIDFVIIEELISFFLLVAGLIVFLICYFNWCKKHKIPLTEDEIARLSKKRQEKELRRINGFVRSFKKERYVKNQQFNPQGSFTQCNIDTKIFPSYIASQLYGKKHEWWVLGLVRENKVVWYWANKGIREQVSLKINFYSILSMCEKYKCTAILDLHNHPNSNPSKYSTLVASKQDTDNSKMFGEISSKNGISFISFVCSIGEWIIYHRTFTDTLKYIPEHVTIEYIRKQNGISEEQNLRLHKELGLFHK